VSGTVVRPAPIADRLTVRLQVIDDVRSVPATLTTRNMADARARISGLLVSLQVKEGDRVRPGQVIARIKDDRLTLQTGAFDAQVNSAAAEAVRAQADLARTRTLYAQGIYAQARLDQVEAQARAANANLASARSLRGASAELSAQGTVLAPAAGKVLIAPVPVGSAVTAGQSLARITAGPVVVRITLPEGEAAALKVGDMVKLAADDLQDLVGQGRVTQVYPAISGGQVIADVSAEGLSQDLIGKRVRAQVRIGERRALIIPRRYVGPRFGMDYIRLVRVDGSVSEIPIQTSAGPTVDTVEVLSGLQVGDVLTAPEGAR